MKGKTAKRLVSVVAALIVVMVALGQPVHAQSTNLRFDRASYVPGDSGTLYVTVVNTADTPIEIRNLTIYFPWAQLVDGKWPSGANVTDNLNPWVTLGSQGSSNNAWSYSTSFTIPSWYAGNPLTIFGPGSNCPGRFDTRYSQAYHGCVFIGVSGNSPFYDNTDFGIAMALPTYTPLSIVSEWLPIATLVVLVVATAFLGMAWMSLRRAAKKA